MAIILTLPLVKDKITITNYNLRCKIKCDGC